MLERQQLIIPKVMFVGEFASGRIVMKLNKTIFKKENIYET